MSNRFVRSSKYRHVFAKQPKSDQCFVGVKITRNAWDSNFIEANPKYFAIAWETGGGGSVMVQSHVKPTRIAPNPPLISGHKGAVLSHKFHPFNDQLLATASEDCYVKIWGIPDDGLTDSISTPLQSLMGHKRKVGGLAFNPVANNVLASSSTDYSVKVWDIEKGDEKVQIDGHSNIIQSLDWNYNGSLLASSSKDKKIRVLDPRSGSVAVEGEGHLGVKGSRLIWLGDSGKILTVGFTRSSEREMKLWDSKDFSKPIKTVSVDTASGIIMPFYDMDTKLLFLAGKGDGNIRYYEVTEDSKIFYPISEFKSSTPQRGMALLPKRAVNVSVCEVIKLFKLGTKMVEPLSFQVPRKSDMFQDDIFPDCYAGVAGVEADAWFSGTDADPKTRAMAPGFVAPDKPKQEFKPVVKEEAGPKNEKELREEYEKLTKRVAYLEAEMLKKDQKIKELSG